MRSAAEGTLNRWLADRYLIFLALSESGLLAVVRWVTLSAEMERLLSLVPKQEDFW